MNNKNTDISNGVKIIIGLGNPGEKYNNTPHNIGFEAIDEFAKENNFPDFKLSKKFNALISEKDDILLAKPQTFMNESGKSVKKIIRNSKSTLRGASSEIRNLIIIHDDIDLELGKIKVSKNRGSAGHKGVESIIKELGNKDFIRIRIGVSKEEKPDVLKKFSQQDKELAKKTLSAIDKTIKTLKV